MVSELWEGIVEDLQDNASTLGIKTAEQAEIGKATVTKTPGCLVWLDFDESNIPTHRGTPSGLRLSPSGRMNSWAPIRENSLPRSHD